MRKIIKRDNGADESVKEFLTFLLATEEVSAVFSLRKIKKTNSVDYGLITDIDQLDDIVPFYPFMPVNAGQMLSRFGAMTKPVAAVVRPCELRAFTELVKREQGTFDNFLFITYTCGGVLPMKTAVTEDIDKLYSKYWKDVKDF